MFRPYILFSALALCLLGASMPAFADTPELTRLPNGMTVLIREDDRFPLVSLRLYVRTGSAYESATESGISHVLEHMVFKGTEARPKGAVATDIERAGGYLNAATSFDYTVYLTDMPAESWKLGLEVLADMAFSPALDPKELESEKQVVISELKRGDDTPESRLFETLQAQALKGTPYARPIIGTVDTINAITSGSMRDYITRRYQPQSMLAVIAGNVKPDEALAEAQRLFGNLRNTLDVTPAQPIAAQDLGLKASVLVEKGPWNKAYVMLALPVPGFTDADSPGLDLLAHLIGGDRTSLFYRTYKYERQLVDDISVSNSSFERIGLFIVSAELDTDKLPEFVKGVTNDLARLKASQFTDEEIRRARLNIEDGLFRAKETLPGLASKIGYFQLFDNGEQGEANYLRTLENTGPEQLDSLIERWLQPEQSTLAALVPENSTVSDVELSRIVGANWPPTAATAATQAAQSQTEPETVTLGPGRTVILLPDHTLPYTALDMVFTGGGFLLAPDQQGLAALTADALTSGTKKLSAPQMEAFQSDRAASLNASAGRQSFTLSLREPSRFDADMFGLLEQSIVSPAFAPAEIDRSKTSQLAAIQSAEDQPLGLAFRRLTPFLFPGHPYGYYQLGQPDQVRAYGVKDIRDYWAKQTAQPWVLAVCGSFDRDEVLKLAQRLPVPSAQKPVPPAPVWTKESSLTLHLAGRNQAHLLLIFPTAGRAGADTPALELLQNILDGQSGLLFRDLRDEHGLGYTVTAWNWQASDAGFMAFYIGTDPGKLDAARQGFERVIGELRETPLNAEEINRGKNQMRGSYYRDHQRLGSRSNEAATLTTLGYDQDYNRQVIESAAKLNAAELQAIAQKYLIWDKAYTVVVQP